MDNLNGVKLSDLLGPPWDTPGTPLGPPWDPPWGFCPPISTHGSAGGEGVLYLPHLPICTCTSAGVADTHAGAAMRGEVRVVNGIRECYT